MGHSTSLPTSHAKYEPYQIRPVHGSHPVHTQTECSSIALVIWTDTTKTLYNAFVTCVYWGSFNLVSNLFIFWNYRSSFEQTGYTNIDYTLFSLISP